MIQLTKLLKELSLLLFAAELLRALLLGSFAHALHELVGGGSLAHPRVAVFKGDVFEGYQSFPITGLPHLDGTFVPPVTCDSADSRLPTVRSILCSLSRPNRPIRKVWKSSGAPS